MFNNTEPAMEKKHKTGVKTKSKFSHFSSNKFKKAVTVPKIDCVVMATVSTAVRLKANYGMYLKRVLMSGCTN